MQNCRDRMEYYIRSWFSRAFRGLQVYDWTIRARGWWADTCTPESCPFPRGLHQWMSSAKTVEPIEMPFRGLTRAGSRNNVLVAWAHWRNLVNTIEPSAVPAKGQQRVLVRQLVHMQQRLSLYPLLTHLSVTLNFPHKNLPATRPFVKILLITCYCCCCCC